MSPSIGVCAGLKDLAIPSCAIIANLFKFVRVKGASVATTLITVLLDISVKVFGFPSEGGIPSSFARFKVEGTVDKSKMKLYEEIVAGAEGTLGNDSEFPGEDELQQQVS